MPRHKTRKEKLKQASKRVATQPDKSASQSPVKAYDYSFTKGNSSSKVSNTQVLLRVEKKYIIRDLIKTLIISGLLVVALIGIYFYLRYN